MLALLMFEGRQISLIRPDGRHKNIPLAKRIDRACMRKDCCGEVAERSNAHPC